MIRMKWTGKISIPDYDKSGFPEDELYYTLFRVPDSSVGSVPITDSKSSKYVVTIPSKGRPDTLAKLMNKMPFLNNPSTLIGVEYGEIGIYSQFIEDHPSVSVVYYYNNRHHSGWMREILRQVTYKYFSPIDYLVMADDNAYYDEQSLKNLIYYSAIHPTKVIMSGAHKMSRQHFYKKICDAAAAKGEHSVRKYGGILIAFPTEFYRDNYSQDPYLPAWPANHAAIAAILHGYELRMCIDCIFTKTRHQAGGVGNNTQRELKAAWTQSRLSATFGKMLGKYKSRGKKAVPKPWAKMMDNYMGKVSQIFPETINLWNPNPKFGIDDDNDNDTKTSHAIAMQTVS